ncbi:MAG: hypothetical protein Q4C54_01760 [Clostridia bacterium]|nr:hypothetical protein [Clostridia bacterium]
MKTIQAILPNWADYIIYAAIIIVTVIGVFKCLCPLWGTTHALKRAVKKLQEDDRSGGKPVWQETRFMGNRLKGSWLRFLQNAEQLDRRGLPCNVEDYINDDTVTHGPGNAQLAEMIPSLLTSLGILGTFIGLMRGLTGLNMSDAEALMKGIPVLLDGMKGAFGTSVLGISCSLLFNMSCKISQGSSYHAIDRFVEAFTSLAMQRPLDNDVQLICQNQDRNHMLFNATDGLASQMAGSIEVAVSRALSPVARSMDEFLVASTKAQVEGVGRIVTSFVEQMNQSLNKQFLALGQTLTEVNRNQRDALDKIQQSLTNADTILTQAQELRSISGSITTQFEQYVAGINEARKHDAQFEASAADMLTRLNDAAANQHAALASL